MDGQITIFEIKQEELFENQIPQEHKQYFEGCYKYTRINYGTEGYLFISKKNLLFIKEGQSTYILNSADLEIPEHYIYYFKLMISLIIGGLNGPALEKIRTFLNNTQYSKNLEDLQKIATFQQNKICSLNENIAKQNNEICNLNTQLRQEKSKASVLKSKMKISGAEFKKIINNNIKQHQKYIAIIEEKVLDYADEKKIIKENASIKEKEENRDIISLQKELIDCYKEIESLNKKLFLACLIIGILMTILHKFV